MMAAWTVALSGVHHLPGAPETMAGGGSAGLVFHRARPRSSFARSHHGLLSDAAGHVPGDAGGLCAGVGLARRRARKTLEAVSACWPPASLRNTLPWAGAWPTGIARGARPRRRWCWAWRARTNCIRAKSSCSTASTTICSGAPSRSGRSCSCDIPDVYLAPGSEAAISPHPEWDDVSNFVLPADEARRGLENAIRSWFIAPASGPCGTSRARYVPPAGDPAAPGPAARRCGRSAGADRLGPEWYAARIRDSAGCRAAPAYVCRDRAARISGCT